ncbi:hypothetical protein HK102_007234, partial [Quaeritorhiza haematococci]
CLDKAHTAAIARHARLLNAASPVDVQLVAAVDEMTFGREMSVTFDFRSGTIRGAADIASAETCWSPEPELRTVEVEIRKKLRDMITHIDYLKDGDYGFDLGGPRVSGMMKIVKDLTEEVYAKWMVLGELGDAIEKEKDTLERLSARVERAVNKRKNAGNSTAVETPNQASAKSVIKNRIDVMAKKHEATSESIRFGRWVGALMEAEVLLREKRECKRDPLMKDSIDLFPKTTVTAITLALRTLVRSFVECRLAVLLRAAYLQCIVITDTLNSKSMVYAFFAIRSSSVANTRMMLTHTTGDFGQNHSIPVIAWVSDGASAGLGHSIHGDYHNTYLSLVRASKEEFRTILQPAGSSMKNKAKVSVNLLLELPGDYLRRDGDKEDNSNHESLRAWLERNLALENPQMIAKRKRDFEDIAALKEQRKRARRSKANNER